VAANSPDRRPGDVAPLPGKIVTVVLAKAGTSDKRSILLHFSTAWGACIRGEDNAPEGNN